MTKLIGTFFACIEYVMEFLFNSLSLDFLLCCKLWCRYYTWIDDDANDKILFWDLDFIRTFLQVLILY